MVKKYQDQYMSDIIDISVRNCSTDTYDQIYEFENINLYRFSEFQDHLDINDD